MTEPTPDHDPAGEARPTPDPPVPIPPPPHPLPARPIVWLKGVVDPGAVPPHLTPNAVYLGLDTGTRDVFIHAPSLRLEMLEVARAFGTESCVFANPSGVGSTDEPFVTIDHLERYHGPLFEDYGLHDLRQRVRATYSRDRKR